MRSGSNQYVQRSAAGHHAGAGRSPFAAAVEAALERQSDRDAEAATWALDPQGDEWRKNGITTRQSAGEWGDVPGVSPSDAGSAERADINPHEARQWLSASESIEDACEWRSRGFTLRTFRDWPSFGFTPQHAQEWRDAGIADAEEAFGWLKNDLPAAAGQTRQQAALAWKSTGLSPAYCSAWVAEGVKTPGAVGAWLANGFGRADAKEAGRWLAWNAGPERARAWLDSGRFYVDAVLFFRSGQFDPP